MSTAKPTVEEKIMELQHYVESLVTRLNDCGNPDEALIAQRAVISLRELRNACQEAAIDHCDFDWQPEITANG